ncbi:hypothetical protein [Flavobacterium sp. 5]|uniref:hypothetical protein n=1 Tax=Flavobacterium sp. 5 TaxID=2035199 RepID=UPI000CB7CBD6|nr:hypothetical protein [Flavobacterium sp. 5]PKB16574.1 hypothetical protein CLU82_1714 [Flavobacterium sp. 5]
MIKYTFTLCLLFLLSQTILGQTQIDKNISIRIPEKVQKFDTISGNTSVLAYYSKNENDSYIILKESKISKENETDTLDKDLKSLKQKYDQIISSQIDAMSKNGFIFKDSTQIKINNFIGYNLIYKGIDSENKNAESNILYLNGSTYIISYSKVKNFSEINKNTFFNSLQINNSNSLKQIQEKSTVSTYLSFIIQYIFPLVFLIGIVFYFKRRTKKNSN